MYYFGSLNSHCSYTQQKQITHLFTAESIASHNLSLNRASTALLRFCSCYVHWLISRVILHWNITADHTSPQTSYGGSTVNLEWDFRRPWDSISTQHNGSWGLTEPWTVLQGTFVCQTRSVSASAWALNHLFTQRTHNNVSGISHSPSVNAQKTGRQFS